MEDLKGVFDKEMSWEIQNKKNTRETAKKMYSVYGQSFFTNHQEQNWFSKFRSSLVWFGLVSLFNG